jgi:hypothetical protein
VSSSLLTERVKIPFTALSPEIQEKYGYDSRTATAYGLTSRCNDPLVAVMNNSQHAYEVRPRKDKRGVDPDFGCASVRSAVVRGTGRSQQRLRQVRQASVAMARFFKFGTFDQEVVTTYDSGGLVVLVDRTMRALWSCAGNISSLRS